MRTTKSTKLTKNRARGIGPGLHGHRRPQCQRYDPRRHLLPNWRRTMSNTFLPGRWPRAAALFLILAVATATTGATQEAPARFHLQEATIASIQQAIRTGQITTVGLVELYLKRIKAYNGTCVQRAARHSRSDRDDPAGRPDQRAGDAQSAAGCAHDLGLRRAESAKPDRSRRRFSEHAGRARSGRRAGSSVQADRHAGRPAARRRDGDQGSVRHLRPAHHLGRRRAIRERPSARRCDVRQAAA